MEMNLPKTERPMGELLWAVESPSGSAAGSEGRLEAIRRYLEVENERLQQFRHLAASGASQPADESGAPRNGAAVAAMRSSVADRLIQHLAATVRREGLGAAADSLSIVALGGYGRSELSPCSDIDILFLYPGKAELPAVTRLNESLLYLLWDTGFTVGHSVRSLAECLAMANEDAVSRHSLIDARLIWGDAGLVASLAERLDREVFEKNRLAWLRQLLEDQTERYRNFGAVVCLQEPNLKESAGGLRDLHTLGWAARMAEGRQGLAGLLESGIVPASEAETIREGYEFALRIRNELHFQTGRRTDVLSLALQQQLAPEFGYLDTPQQQASELFMRDYYLRARQLHRLTTTYLERLVQRHEKKRWFQRRRVAPAIGGFVMRDGMLEADNPAESMGTSRMMLAFAYAQATGSELSPGLQATIQRGLSGGGEVEATPEVRETFLRMVSATGNVARGLRMMHDLDLLGAVVPEFGRLTCLVQHDLYHRYTVDEHTLRAIEVLDELIAARSKPTERYREIYRRLADPLVLHLGLFFHDIGKGLGGGHTEKGVVIAGEFGARWGLGREQMEAVVFLVREHLTMSHISQRRDLSDEKVIRDFAARVGTIERLDLLTLLTYADINAVGPGVWSEWKDSLLWELHQRTKSVLAPGEESVRARESLVQLLTKSLASEMGEDEVRRHLEALPADYGRYTAPATIIEHLRLVTRLNSQTVRTSWKVDLPTRCANLHLCARNRRGLLAGVTGALTAQGVNILSVHLNTRADGVAVDSFKVRDTAGEPITDPARWQQIDYAITRALNGECDVEAAVTRRLRAQNSSRFRKRRLKGSLPVSFSWDQQSSERSTILEVRASDRLGLAYRIASTLSALGLDIVFAKVATEKHLALDIFYVVNESGDKLPDESLHLVEQALQEALHDHGVVEV